MKQTRVDPVSVLLCAMLAMVLMGTFSTLAETTRRTALERDGVLKEAVVTQVAPSGYVEAWQVPGLADPTPPRSYCPSFHQRQPGDALPVRVHPDDPTLHRAECGVGYPVSQPPGLVMGFFGLAALALVNLLRAAGAVDRARLARGLFATAAGSAIGVLFAYLTRSVSPFVTYAVAGTVAAPVGVGLYLLSKHLRGIDRDLDVARGAASGARAVAARRLRAPWGKNPVGQGALQLLLGQHVQAYRSLRGHHALAIATDDLYGLVHGLYAIAHRGAESAHFVMQGLLEIGPQNEPSFDRFRAYVLARAAAIAVARDDRAKELALRVEAELMSSSDREVRDYAQYVRAAREAEIDADEDADAIGRAARTAAEVGLDEIAALLERRLVRLKGSGAAYRAA